MARGRSRWLIFHAPQTASLGDATACAVPLKAAGSVLPFSTGCQNMQIRGPESAAKSRRRGAAGASPDPLLVWLFPAWLAAPRPSPQPPRPLPRPARLTLPPTPPGWPLAAPPPRREPGAGGAARPDSGRSRDRCRALAPRAARAEESPGAQCLPGIGVGILAAVESGWRRGSRAAGIPPLPKYQRRSGGDRALPPPVLHRVKWRGGSEVVIHPHRDVQLGSSSHASPARVALPRREARGSSLPPCQYSHSP